MDYYDFYRDHHNRTLDHKNEINTSLSTPIGILTALVASLFYACTSFEYSDNYWLTVAFILPGLFVLFFLAISLFHLAKALSDFHNGYDYAYLADADVLGSYYNDLLVHHNSTVPPITSNEAERLAIIDFEVYLLRELITAAGINQKNNKSKMFHRFQRHNFMTYAFISLSLLIIPFGIDFGINKNKEKTYQIKIVSPIPNAEAIINTDRVIQDRQKKMAKNQGSITVTHTVPKPTPPPTQMIREGVNPNASRPTVKRPGTNK